MANRFEKPPFMNTGGVNVSPTPHQMVDNPNYNRTGLRPEMAAEMDALFPGSAQVLPNNEALFALYKKYTGVGGIEAGSDAEQALAHHGITGYTDWTHFGMTPNLKEDWAPDTAADPSLLADTPFMPNASSPTPNPDTGALEGNRENGWMRPEGPANYGANAEAHAVVYQASFVSDSRNAKAKTAARVQTTLGNAMRSAGGGT